MGTNLQTSKTLEITIDGESPTTRKMARLYFATFWLVVFTGAVRKWLFPGTVIFYLLGDVPIFLAYCLAIRSGFYGRGLIFISVMILSVIVTIQALFQICLGFSPLVAFIGLHNYLFFFPMLFIFPFCLTQRFRRDFLRWSLLLNIPMCLLAIAQNASPRNALINRTSEGGDAFGVPGADVARVSGTFNFVSYYAVWVGFSVALCFGEWLLPSWRRAFRSRGLLIASTISIILSALISASRGAVILAAAAVCGTIAGALVLRSTRALATIAGCILLMPVGAVGTYYLSPAEFNIILERFTSDSGSQNLYERIGLGFFGFLVEPKFSFVGAGVGMGVDASHVGSGSDYNTYTYELSEVDLTRTVMELGTPVGIIYAIARLCFAFCMVLISFRILLSRSSPHVLPLSVFLLLQLYFGDLTRAATMDSTFAMIAASYILGVLIYPDREAIAPGLAQMANGKAYPDIELRSPGSL